MKYFLLLTTLILLIGTARAQEMEEDLYMTPFTNSLMLFKKSEMNKMEVVTYRSSKKLGLVEETSTTYRKGRLKPEKINFSIKYSEYYILEDRKRSVGSYEFDTLDQIWRYERSDYNNRNVRTITHYSFYSYKNRILQREFIRLREYVGEGIEQDSVIYLDSVVYQVSRQHDEYRQDNLSYKGAYTTYNVVDGRLESQTNFLEGFREEVKYTYDSKGQLIRIDNTLIGAEDKSTSNYTVIRYSKEGLITETIFYDENDQALEKKVFSYK